MWIAFTGLALLYVGARRALAAGVAAARAQAAASEYAALHDHVTELPNRVLFHDRVHQAAKRAARDGCGARGADDRPRPLQGDQRHPRPPQRRPAAVQVGQRLTGTLRAGDPSPASAATSSPSCSPTSTASRTRSTRPRACAARLRAPRARGLASRSTPASASRSPRARRRPRDAAPARRRRHVHGQGAHPATPSTTAASTLHARLALIADLRRAIDDDELVLHYQPKADLLTGASSASRRSCAGSTPSSGSCPGRVHPLAENTGLIRPLTLYVLDKALAQAARWTRRAST